MRHYLSILKVLFEIQQSFALLFRFSWQCGVNTATALYTFFLREFVFVTFWLAEVARMIGIPEPSVECGGAFIPTREVRCLHAAQIWVKIATTERKDKGPAPQTQSLVLSIFVWAVFTTEKKKKKTNTVYAPQVESLMLFSIVRKMITVEWLVLPTIVWTIFTTRRVTNVAHHSMNNVHRKKSRQFSLLPSNEQSSSYAESPS